MHHESHGAVTINSASFQSDKKLMKQEFCAMGLTCLICADHSRWNAWIPCPNWIGGHHSEFIFYPGI